MHQCRRLPLQWQQRLLVLLCFVGASLSFQIAPNRPFSRQLPSLSSMVDSNRELSSKAPPTSSRRVQRVDRFSRLPVWPVWNGVFIFLVSRIFGFETAAKLEDAVGGRVCPNFFSEGETSPFVMLVHHRHSFFRFDPLRWIQDKLILPEGFPAHPHRGFVTLTYILQGGFAHRDSLGVQQRYGAADGLPHSQWLNTGAGMLHEEMFDISGMLSNQELYQLWINLPAAHKLGMPTTTLLGGDGGARAPRVADGSSETVVLVGSYDGEASDAPAKSDMAVLHVTVQPRGKEWRYRQIPDSFRTMMLYLRRGSATIGDAVVPVHHTAYLTPDGAELVVRNDHPEDELDFLLLAGAPLGEPVAAQGSMVMNTPDEINAAMMDYQRGFMGRPWDHKLTDDQWKEHVRRNPCRYGAGPPEVRDDLDRIMSK